MTSAQPMSSLQFLGSGDAFSSGGRFQTSFYVTHGDFRFLIDCGATTLMAMKQQGVDTNSVDAILLSHYHGDHFGGIPFFLFEAMWASDRKKKLTIAGPGNVQERVEKLMEVIFAVNPAINWSFPLEFVELPVRDVQTIGPLEVYIAPVIHSDNSLSHGLRIQMGDKILAYSGDTEWTDALIELSTDANLFVTECFAFEAPSTGHMNHADLVANKNRLGAKRIILTHMSEAMLGQSNLEFEKAEDGLIVQF